MGADRISGSLTKDGYTYVYIVLRTSNMAHWLGNRMEWMNHETAIEETGAVSMHST